ncbi:alpha/beta hydrolase [Georgenia daeguensis]|uniref:Alpha/beta fold hydrolase n=1 Tax=Georgenia daeguensis TaxID=908355 RepID=A0ABP8EUG8_9MICO
MATGPEALTFLSGGTRLAGNLYRPDRGGTTPGVVVCTGFGGTQDTPSVVAAATTFAEHGWAALTFDYRSFGRSDGRPRQVVSIRGQLADIRAAVAQLRRLPGVAADRVALWGTSLGGGHVVTVAADDPRIAAVVAQVPFNGFPRKVEGRSARSQRALLRAMAGDALRGAFRLPPGYIKAVGRPGELAVMASDEAQRTVENLASDTWENRVAPRALWSMMRYRPGSVASRLTMPLLVCVAALDRETQGEQTDQLVRAAPRVEVRTYPCSHFDMYRPDVRERVLADQVDFLSRALATA